MDMLTQIVDGYGYWLFLGLGFVEFAGLPIASVPLLIAAGAVATTGGIHPLGVAAVAALGGFLADGAWYGLARWRGQKMVDAACGLSSNPTACILSVEARLRRLGDPYILVAKFVPGAGNLIGPAAGLARRPVLAFLPRDALALLAWAGVYVGLGWIFADQVNAVLRVVVGYARLVAVLAVILIVGAFAWRIIKARSHDHTGSHHHDT